MLKPAISLIFGAAVLAQAAGWAGPGTAAQGSCEAREIDIPVSGKEASFFALPVSIAHDDVAVFVLDAEDNAIKVFSKTGEFLRSIGRKGQGPAEFDFPTSLDVRAGRVYVCDSFNSRIQILDREGGYLKGFKTSTRPENVLVLPGDRVLVASHPGRPGLREKMLRCYSADGRFLWEALDSSSSGDSVEDALRNLFFLLPGQGGEFFVVFKHFETKIFRFDAAGRLLDKAQVGLDFPSRTVKVPLRGRDFEVSVFCWAGAAGPASLFLLASGYTDDDDLGPGREVFQTGFDGGALGIIRFPTNLRAFSVDGERVYAVDTESVLRYFQVRKE